MPLLKPETSVDKNEIKRAEQKLKNIMGGKLFRDPDFMKLMKVNEINNPHNCWDKINKQLKHEIKTGLLTFDDIESRIYQLLLLESPYDELITIEEFNAAEIEGIKRDIIAKGTLPIQIPYRSSGVGDVAIGTAVWGKNGAILGALNEGETKWKTTTLFIMDNGINVKSTGRVVLYEDVKQVVLGNKSFSRTIVTILTKNNDDLICKMYNDSAIAFKSLIEDYINLFEEIPNAGNYDELNDNADILLKYADLCERGFITQEEFEQKKEELLYSAYDNHFSKSKNIQQNKQFYCARCGNIIEENSNFCTNCGFKIVK